MFTSIIAALMMAGVAYSNGPVPQGGIEESALYAKIPKEVLRVLPEPDEIARAYVLGSGCQKYYPGGTAECVENGQMRLRSVYYHETVTNDPEVAKGSPLVCRKELSLADDSFYVTCTAGGQKLEATVGLHEQADI